jgi:mannose-1-phosphate guanylyltransferase
MTSPVLPVVLCGGAGTRLWPVSRTSHPKPFIRLADGESLLEKAYRRAAAIAGVQHVLTVTNREHYQRAKDEYLAARVTAQPTFMLEPLPRNTAPALALAALWAQDCLGPDTVLVALPADHLIAEIKPWLLAVQRAAALAREGWLVTFGVQPQHPATGFGYIHIGPTLTEGLHAVERFVEKPPLDDAQRYVASGQYCWNMGVFVMAVQTLLQTMQQVCPDVIEAAQTCWQHTRAQRSVVGPVVELDPGTFSAQPDISIDYAVMERAARVAVAPGAWGWSDIGSWTALSELVPSDAEGNRVSGHDVELLDVRNTFIHSEHHLVAAIGVRDLCIIDTPDALLVAHADRVQDVKHIAQRLQQQGHEAAHLHRTVLRPWGSYTVLEEGPRFKIKRLEVRPGAALSLQLHHHRSEHWVVVGGVAKVTNGDQVQMLHTNQSTYIPAGQRHRLENPGKLDLVVIEVQCGDYLGEDDIVRFADEYDRV